MMIARRALLATALLPLAVPQHRPALPPSGRIAFRVARKDAAIGSHVLSFAPVAGGVDIHIAVDIVVRLGPIPLFRYSLRGTEQWRGGQVAHVETHTDNDGTADFMRATRDDRGLWVTGSKAARYLAPPDALPATHWNEAELDGHWINPQNGRLVLPVVAPQGMAPVLLADGRSLMADKFDVSGKAPMQLWYSGTRQWSGLVFTARDGSTVRYELT